jgi:transcriptional regulator with XRE-family HTH domain
MSERSNRLSKLLSSQKSRTAYIKAKLGVLVPAQIRALRLKSKEPSMPFQRDLAREAELHQSRISMFETPGMANITLETLAKVAAALRSGVVVKFVPFSEMLAWENSFSPNRFDVLRLNEDASFIHPEAQGFEFLISGIGASTRGKPMAVVKTSGAVSSNVNEDALGALPASIPLADAQPMEMPNAG